MRIKSNFKDFYDSLQGQDTDKDTVYVRKQEIISLYDENLEEKYKHCYAGVFGYSGQEYNSNGTCSRWRWSVGVISFCGTWYPFIDNIDINKKRTIIYNRDIAIKHCLVSYENKQIMTFFDKFKDPKSIEHWNNLVERFGPVFAFVWGDWAKYNSPHLIINPLCKHWGLQAVLHPAVAYDELWKWFCNKQRPARPIPEMSNDIKIEQHGFDLKTSFRKDKQNKRNKP